MYLLSKLIYVLYNLIVVFEFVNNLETKKPRNFEAFFKCSDCLE